MSNDSIVYYEDEEKFAQMKQANASSPEKIDL
jgi:hypothetical protein